MFEQLTFVLALFALGLSLEALISTITKEELKRTLVPSKKVFVPFLRRTLLFFKRVPVLLRKLGTGIKRTLLFFKRIPVIGLVLGLGIAIAAIVFAVNYWPKPAPEPEVPPPYYEIITTVTSMIDGDTTWVRIENIVVELDPEGEVYEGNLERVRYGGGVDAPETWMEGGPEATEFIENLIPVGTTVYLDLNDLSIGGQTGRPYRGTYERLIAVIYTVIDGQWVNINAELLRWGQEEYPDFGWLKYIYFPSEWDPYEWLENDYPYVRGWVSW